VTNTFVPGALEVTKALVLGDYFFPETVTVDFIVTVTGPSYPAGTILTFHVVNGVLTNSPQTLSNLIPGVYNVTETDPGIAWEVTNITGNVTVVPNQTGTRTITNRLKLPHTTMSAIAYVWETTADGNITLTLSDTNDGEVPLTNAHIHVRQIVNGVITDFDSLFWADVFAFSGGDTDDLFEPGETWTWEFSTFISATTTFEVWGHGTDPLGNPVDYIPGSPDSYNTEFDDVTIEVNLATRTQGFWATHLDFTTYIFNTYLPGGINLGYPLKVGAPFPDTANVTTINQLMSIFWANNAKNDDGKKRSAIGQARETAANQALAAILNSAMPGGAPLPTFNGSPLTIASIANILTNGTIAQIKALNSALDAFNNSGDDIALDPSLPATGKADPQGAKAIADIPWADSP
jgi:hypothetical protein